MSATGITAVVFSFAAGLGCGATASVALMHRRSGRVAWRGVPVDYKPRAAFLALLAIGLMLNGVAVLLTEGNHRHPAFLIAMGALLFVLVGVAIGGLAAFAARRSS